MAEITRVATRDMPVFVARFVGDLRLVITMPLPTSEERGLLEAQLAYLKHTLESLGLKVHSKAGKLMQATQTIK